MWVRGSSSPGPWAARQGQHAFFSILGREPLPQEMGGDGAAEGGGRGVRNGPCVVRAGLVPGPRGSARAGGGGRRGGREGCSLWESLTAWRAPPPGLFGVRTRLSWSGVWGGSPFRLAGRRGEVRTGGKADEVGTRMKKEAVPATPPSPAPQAQPSGSHQRLYAWLQKSLDKAQEEVVYGLRQVRPAAPASRGGAGRGGRRGCRPTRAPPTHPVPAVPPPPPAPPEGPARPAFAGGARAAPGRAAATTRPSPRGPPRRRRY